MVEPVDTRDLKSLGASPRDGSSPSSGTSNYSMIRYRNKVAFLFENDHCVNFVSFLTANPIIVLV